MHRERWLGASWEQNNSSEKNWMTQFSRGGKNEKNWIREAAEKHVTSKWVFSHGCLRGKSGRIYFTVSWRKILETWWKKEQSSFVILESLFFPLQFHVLWDCLSVWDLPVASVHSVLDEVRDFSGTRYQPETDFISSYKTSDNVWRFNWVSILAAVLFALHGRRIKTTAEVLKPIISKTALDLRCFCRPRQLIICFSLVEPRIETELSAH